MLALGVEPFDGRHLSASDGADRRNAGSGRATFHQHGAGPAHANPTTEFGPRQADLITDRPEERRVIRTSDRDGAVIELERNHDRKAPDTVLTWRAPTAVGWQQPSFPRLSRGVRPCVCDADKRQASRCRRP